MSLWSIFRTQDSKGYVKWSQPVTELTQTSVSVTSLSLRWDWESLWQVGAGNLPSPLSHVGMFRWTLQQDMSYVTSFTL